MKVSWPTLVLCVILGAVFSHYIIVPYLKGQDFWPKKQNKIEIKLPNLEIQSK